VTLIRDAPQALPFGPFVNFFFEAGSTFNYMRGTNVAKNQNFGTVQGVMGDDAEVHGNTFVNNVWAQHADSVDLAAARAELEQLIAHLRPLANTDDRTEALAEVVKAKKAAEAGNGPTMLEHLKAGGKWALDGATQIGVRVVAALLSQMIITGGAGPAGD
jgi:hypothetical protein